MKVKSNGEYKKVVLKVNDSIPLGGIIDFEGDTVPEGYERVEDESEIYSEEEQVIGKWIDGKKLYRKVVNFGTLPNATLKNVKHQIDNLDMVVDIRGIAKTTDGTFLPIPFSSGIDMSSNVQLTIDNIAIFIRTAQDHSNNEGTIIIIEYTKTTD